MKNWDPYEDQKEPDRRTKWTRPNSKPDEGLKWTSLPDPETDHLNQTQDHNEPDRGTE